MTIPPDERLTDSRTPPRVWVKKVALYESLDPVSQIREIDFTTGLNIVWGTEGADSDGGLETGHGIGKTTLCRLIRYCLGERTFGQKHVVEEVRCTFPNGYVGAVVVIKNKEWAVLRPLGQKRGEYAQEDSSLSNLIEQKPSKSFAGFLSQLEASAISRLPTGNTFSGGEPIQWVHLLAMCSRDQEARYDRFWNWRHARSESGTPHFSKPKVDAGLCVRAVLGLLNPAEPQLRAKLDDLAKTLTRTQESIKERQAEPNFHITRLLASLKTDFGVEDAAMPSPQQDQLFPVGLLAETRIRELAQQAAGIDEQLPPLDRQISLAAASLLEPTELRDQQREARDVTAEGTDTLLTDLEELGRLRQTIRDVQAAYCRPGGVLYGDCSYVQSRLAGIEQNMREAQRATLPTVSEREQVATRLAEQASRQNAIIDRVRLRLDDLNRQKNDLLEQRRSVNELARRLPTVVAELQQWEGIIGGTKADDRLQSLQADERNTTAEIKTAESQLEELIRDQVDRVRQFEAHFDRLVRRTLSDEYKGMIQLTTDGISFRIHRGESLSGEAFDTLAVLLADLALLTFSPAVPIHHPRMLLHDSPREADLSGRIYEKLLEVAADSLQATGEDGNSPFQYIVTTTTPPPKRLQKPSVTKLKLTGGSGSLFGKQLQSAKSPEPTLFDSLEDE